MGIQKGRNFSQIEWELLRIIGQELCHVHSAHGLTGNKIHRGPNVCVQKKNDGDSPSRGSPIMDREIERAQRCAMAADSASKTTSISRLREVVLFPPQHPDFCTGGQPCTENRLDELTPSPSTPSVARSPGPLITAAPTRQSRGKKNASTSAPGEAAPNTSDSTPITHC